MKIAFIVLLLAVFSLAGCSKPTIDATDSDSLKTSIEAIHKELSDAKRAEFDQSVALLATCQFGNGLKQAFAGLTGDDSAPSEDNKFDKLCDLDGKTADQVIADAKEFKNS